MGYGIRSTGYHNSEGIRTFWPDDTEDKIYLDGTFSLQNLADLLETAKAKWPGADLSNIKIGAEYIQTDCLGYDRYDSGDYTPFITIEYQPA